MLKPAAQIILEVAQEKALQEERRRQQTIELNESHRVRCINEANEWLCNTLPALIERKIKSSENELFVPSRCGYSGELSDNFFKPNTDHCKLVLNRLTEFGYTAKVITHTVGNIDYESYGDGEYNIVPAPGTHEEYQLQITW